MQNKSSRVCFTEKMFRRLGFRLMHDGSRNPQEFKLDPNDVRFFTRKLRLFLDGEPTKTIATFKYDYRSGVMIDCTISSKDSGFEGKENIILEYSDELAFQEV